MSDQSSRLRRALRRTVAALTVSLTVAGLTLATASSSPAQAASHARNGVCDSGEFCYFYDTGEKGSVSDFTSSVPDLGATQPSCWEFRGPGRGSHHCVKNQASSVWNRTGHPVTVYYNSGYRGHSQSFKAGAKSNLDATLKKENAAHRFNSASGGSHPGSSTGSKAVARAQVWVDKHISYSMNRTFQGYRTDCSGFVSMAWGMSKPGTTTPYFHNLGHTISKSALQRGDALLNKASGAHGHIVLFDKWENSSHTKYWGYEETGSHGAIHRVIDYPYFRGYGTFLPFRHLTQK